MTGYGATDLPLAVAHRGGAALGIENTMEALARSWALGIGYLEVDVRLTRDGVPVLFHDATLSRLTGRGHRVGDLALAELARIPLPHGQWVPTLADVLHAYPSARFMVDIKDRAALEPSLRILSSYDALDRACLTGCWDGMVKTVSARHPEIATALGWRAWSALLLSAHAGVRARCRTGGQFVHVPAAWGPMRTCVPRVFERAHDLGLRVVVWGVEDAPTMHRLLDEGADGIITDRPDLLREVLVARGQWESPTPRDAAAWATS